MLNARRNKNIGKIAVIGNYLPRQCGIATFTTDVSQALAAELTKEENLINIAMDDIPEGYDYPSQVKFRVRHNVKSDYVSAADYLNANGYDAAIIQHEYGIFGGENGDYILQMIQALKMPVITNLHTVLENPTDGQRKVITGLAEYSDRLLVMSHRAREILTRVYGIASHKIEFIPHGIPDVSIKTPGVFNKKFGFVNRDLILTFGLLGPDKGIECMIKAIPAIVKEHPNVLYLILGQTHPHILKNSGDSYRESLNKLIYGLGMQDHIQFNNNFVNLETLVQYLQTSKIYAIPYLKKEQITSGTLAYALGVGTPVVSTPFWYAEELLAEGRGQLVPFNDSESMAKAINYLLSNDKDREIMRFKGYQHGRSMIWREVSKSHLDVIAEIKERKRTENKQQVLNKYHKIYDELPEINLSHLKTITDDTGLLQHAKYMTPNLEHGYCVDDNARALIAVTRYYSLKKEKESLPLLHKYLAFLNYAFNKDNGRFRNFMSYDRRWMELEGSEDSHSRALWSLGICVKEAPNSAIRNTAMSLFLEALSAVENFYSPRALSYSILGLQAYLTIYGGDTNARRIRDKAAIRLYDLFKNNANEDWPWCENIATYANAVLPHALIVAGKWVPDKNIYDTGIKALKWLLKMQTAPEGHLSLIGNDGWFNKNGHRAMFDQQPIEAKALVEACIAAYIDTSDKKWLEESERCLCWFLGQNDLQLQVCDCESGGCADGLERQGINCNHGAESTLAWLISLINMHSINKLQTSIDEIFATKEETFKESKVVDYKNL